MVSVGQVLDVIDLIAAPARCDEIGEVMREAFCAATGTSAADLDIELSAGDVIGGVRDAVYAGAMGVWVDHNEPFTINDQTQDLIETQVGVTNPSTATFYRYDGEDAAEGLLGFDNWLQADHETKRQQRIDNGDTEEQINKTLKNLRLIEIETGADYALTIQHPNNNIDPLIDALTTIHINAWRPKEPAPPPTTNYNIGELIWDHLTNHHNYQDRSKLVGKKLNGSLFRVIDDQHTLTVRISPFKKGQREGTYARIDCELARTDINGLGDELGFQFPPYAPTISEDQIGVFLGRPDFDWENYTHSRQDVIDYLDEWIPKLDAICNLEFVESGLPDMTEHDATISDVRWLKVVVNRMLNGWSPETDDAVLTDHHQYVAEVAPPGGQRIIKIEARIATIRDWISNNPTGLR